MEYVKSLLMDVALTGVIVIDKKKLLWLLDWGQDRPRAWAELLNLWEDIGQDRNALYGLEIYGKVVLMMRPEKEGEFARVSSWAEDEVESS